MAQPSRVVLQAHGSAIGIETVTGTPDLYSPIALETTTARNGLAEIEILLQAIVEFPLGETHVLMASVTAQPLLPVLDKTLVIQSRRFRAASVTAHLTTVLRLVVA